MVIRMLILGIMLLMPVAGYCDTLRIRIERDIPARSEYFQYTGRGIEKVKEYPGVTVREYYEYKNNTVYKQREVKVNENPREGLFRDTRRGR